MEIRGKLPLCQCGDICIPVSYTHLDVYKRQIEFWQNETQYQSNVIVTYNAGAGRRNPVLNEDASYVVEFTLEDKDTPDVYKRQLRGPHL